MVDVGDKALDFTAPTDTGEVSLAGLKGQTVVLYFYPKDNTTACTLQGKDFSALKADFAKAGAVVVGVSKDSAKSHANFRKKQGLTIDLASDAEGDLCERYGVWGEKVLYGRQYMGLIRTTFLIDKAGVVRRVWRNVRTPGHAAEVLEAVKTLG